MSWQESLWAALAAARLTGLLLVRKRRILFLGLLILLPALLPVVVAALRGPHSGGVSGLALYALIAEYGFLATLAPLGASPRAPGSNAPATRVIRAPPSDRADRAGP